MKFGDLRREAVEWLAAYTELSEQERAWSDGDGPAPRSDDWHVLEDAAGDIVRRLAEENFDG
jgi:hypothetical protein